MNRKVDEILARVQSRREFLARWGRLGMLGGLFLVVAGVVRRSGLGNILRSCAEGDCAGCAAGSVCPSAVRASTHVWQLDPRVCVQCGRCATECVLSPSAVKCVHAFSMCGYCKLCFGFFQPGAASLDSGAENQLCPTGAIRRRLIEEPYYEYTIDEKLCIGCGKCVKGCNMFGNGSLQLQVRHDLCVNCNDCAIARVCPSGAFRRVPADSPDLLKDMPAFARGRVPGPAGARDSESRAMPG